jgi:hypothetical protein
MNIRSDLMIRILAGLIVCGTLWAAQAESERFKYRATNIRAGRIGTIVGTSYNLDKQPSRLGIKASEPYPVPRLAGFSPLVAITTSDARSTVDIDYEHKQALGFTGNALTTPANENFIIGIVDSGSDTDLFAGSFAASVGLTGANLTGYAIPIGGVGGTVDADVSQPLGVFAADLGAVNPNQTLDLLQVTGHWHASVLAAPAIECGGVEAVSGVIGRPLLSLFNTVIDVDTPREVTVDGTTYKSPAVSIQSKSDPLPTYSHQVSLEFGGLSPATTASYYPDFFDLITPQIPTLFALSPLSFPLGGAFFTTLYVREGQQSEIPLRMLVDTGAQTSIISPAVAASLNLPIQPDFTIDVCGVGGFTTGISCYYIDYGRLNALGGALEFSQMPVVVLDLSSPEGGSLDGIVGMNLFWNRNIAFQPSLELSSALSVSAPLNVPWGDNDVDFDVDADDWAAFDQAFSGDAAPAPEFLHFVYNDDGDVGLEELAQFQIAFTGVNPPN